MPYVCGNPAVIPRNSNLVTFLSVRSQCINPAVDRIAFRTLVIPRVMRLKMMPLAAHVFTAQLADVKFRVPGVFAENLIAIGFSVVLDT